MRKGKLSIIDRQHRFYKVFQKTLSYTKRAQKVGGEYLAHKEDQVRHFMQAWAKEVLSLLHIDVIHSGIEPKREPTLLVGNHIGYLDMPILMSMVPAVFVAKHSVKYWPFFGSACKVVGTVFVNRDSKHSRARVGEAISSCIHHRGQSVVLFPTGTTSMGQKPWRQGAFRIAKEYNIQIQPFRLSFSPLRDVAYIERDFFPYHLWNLLGIEKIKTYIDFHEPVYVQDPKEACSRFEKWTKEKWTPKQLSEEMEAEDIQSISEPLSEDGV